MSANNQIIQPYGMFCCPVNTFTPIPWTDAQLAVNALNEIGGECIARSNSCGLAENPRACQGGAAVVVCNDVSTRIYFVFSFIFFLYPIITLNKDFLRFYFIP